MLSMANCVLQQEKEEQHRKNQLSKLMNDMKVSKGSEVPLDPNASKWEDMPINTITLTIPCVNSALCPQSAWRMKRGMKKTRSKMKLTRNMAKTKAKKKEVCIFG